MNESMLVDIREIELDEKSQSSLETAVQDVYDFVRWVVSAKVLRDGGEAEFKRMTMMFDLEGLISVMGYYSTEGVGISVLGKKSRQGYEVTVSLTESGSDRSKSRKLNAGERLKIASKKVSDWVPPVRGVTMWGVFVDGDGNVSVEGGSSKKFKGAGGSPEWRTFEDVPDVEEFLGKEEAAKAWSLRLGEDGYVES